MSDPILPGSTLGVLGSGQLGRMFAIAARRMGYRVHVLSPATDTPTGQVADVEVTADYEDSAAVEDFAHAIDVVTFEFENVPLETVKVVDRFVPVRPAGHVLHTTQHRLREKTFLSEAGFPVTPFIAIRSESDLERVPADHVPGVLKTAAWGYDGKGQEKVDSLEELRDVWHREFRQEAVLEKFVDFERELSVVAARGQDGAFQAFQPTENLHSNHILDVSLSPADVPPEVAQDAVEIAAAVLEKLEVVGVLCVEFFLQRDGRLLINELAPRPHNSGHLTIDAAVSCQFEQQVRTVCGLPLGDATPLRPAAMANLLGDLWDAGEPDWRRALTIPNVKLHLYGKNEPRPGRKMGHLTATGDSVAEARANVLQARKLLVQGR